MQLDVDTVLLDVDVDTVLLCRAVSVCVMAQRPAVMRHSVRVLPPTHKVCIYLARPLLGASDRVTREAHGADQVA